MNLESGVTVSLETVARNLAGGRGLGRAPGVKDEEPWLLHSRVFPEVSVGAWRMQSPLQVGTWEYRVEKEFCFSDKVLLLATPLSPCDSHTVRCIF